MKRKIRRNKTRTGINGKPRIGDFIEVKLIDSGASWSKVPEKPDEVALSHLKWSGRLVRNDSDLMVLDTGGTIEDEHYRQRSDYHVIWPPAIIGKIEILKRGKR